MLPCARIRTAAGSVPSVNTCAKITLRLPNQPTLILREVWVGRKSQVSGSLYLRRGISYVHRFLSGCNWITPRKRRSRLRSTPEDGSRGLGSRFLYWRQRAIRRLQTHRGTAPAVRIRIRDGLGEVPPVTIEVFCGVGPRRTRQTLSPSASNDSVPHWPLQGTAAWLS
jgi:hypothetical protein